MRKALLPLITTTAALILCNQQVTAQNTSPYWSLAGNSNASTSSKLGTTNSIPLRFYTSNVERGHIAASGNWSIGDLANYDARLTVSSASGARGFRVRVGGGTKLVVNGNGSVAIGSLSNGPVNGLYVAGNVGIGTATPSYKLHVEGGSNTAIYGNSSGSYGVFGNSSSTGVYGQGGTIGVYGYAPGGLGYGTGVYGQSSYIGVNGYGGSYGVYATSYNSSGGFGVYGSANTSSGTGIYGTGYYGVKAISPTLYGVDGTGYYVGVIGRGGSTNSYSYGVEGLGNTNGVGVFGQAGSIGVQGYATSSGRYGVYGSGVTGAWAGYFAGPVFSSGGFTSSDRKLKQNITAFTSALDIIGKLQPKSYEYRQDGNYKLMHLPEGTHYGLIAQDLEQVLPNLVKETKFDTRLEQQAQANQEPGKAPATIQQSEVIDFKAVNYTELIPIMIKGMQEQEAENKALKAEVAELRQMILELKGGSGMVTSAGAYLEQNTPNPVRGTTSIRYHVPESSTSALLNLTNAKGELVKTVPLNRSGSGQVTLNTGMLASGTYNYTLYVDGKLADSKRLLIAR